jgi:hypothetical protein
MDRPMMPPPRELQENLQQALDDGDHHLARSLINWNGVEEIFETSDPERFRRLIDMAVEELQSACD